MQFSPLRSAPDDNNKQCGMTICKSATDSKSSLDIRD